jgi:hypothetical protein
VNGGLTPAACGSETYGESSCQRDRSATVKADQVVLGRTAGVDRSVPAEPFGLLATEPKGLPGNPEFRRAGFVDARRIIAERFQMPPALGKVDRSPVVRIYQRVLPELGALVDIRHPRHGQLNELLAKRI